MILLLILSFRFFSRQSSKKLKEGYDLLSFSNPIGKFADSDYINKHKISNFQSSSTGDRSGNPLSNAFDDKSGTYWVSDKAENDTFHPSIFINFSSPVLLEGFLYDTAYHTPDKNSNRIFDGFPGKLKVYTSINDEPLALNAIFSGTLLYSWSRIQFALSEPVKCSRLQLEFYDVSPATSLKSEEKLAGTGGITLIQNFGYDELGIKGSEGNYADGNYVSFHQIPTDDFTYDCTGSREGNPLKNAFDNTGNTYWVSDQPETNDFHPSIYVNFTKPVLLEAFLYDTAYRTAKPNRYFDGFPNTLKIYTALNEGPLTIHTVFTGTPTTLVSRIQYVFSRPIKLTKIQLEFCDVSVAQSLSSSEKLAGVGNLIFIQSFEEDGVGIDQASGNYIDSYFLSKHTISPNNFTYSSTGDKEDHPLSYAFDSVVKSFWVSSKENTDDFHSRIFINFTETVELEAILMYAAFHSGSNSRIFDGFPIKFKVHSQIDDDESTKKSTLFVGTPIFPWETIQFVLPDPVKCNRLELEFVEVTPETVFSNNLKNACLSGLYFIRHFNYVYTKFEVSKGYYVDKAYLSTHLVPVSELKYYSTGDLKGHPIEYAFDSKYGDAWVSSVESTENEHASIFVNFTNPVLLEAIIYQSGYRTESGQKVMVGFPLKLIIHTAFKDEELSPKAFFVGNPEPPSTSYQLVLPEPVACSRVQIEFVEVSPEKVFSSSKRCALAQQIDFISTPFEEITGPIEGDTNSVLVDNKYVKDSVSDANFIDINLPKSDEYVFVVTRDSFEFFNNSFKMNQNKISAIKGNFSSEITIKNCSFTSCSTKNVQGNGGAVNIENCGLEMSDSLFVNSSTTGGAGGCIYTVLNKRIENNFHITNCKFSKSSALYGGAVYVYSNVDENSVVISECTFTDNKALSSSSNPFQYGGSAIFMCAKNGRVLKCKMLRNKGKGGALKIYHDFDQSSKSSKSLKSSLLVVKECYFEIDSESTSSLSYHYNKNNHMTMSVDNCIFTGDLNKGSHHIEGSSPNNVKFNSCKFSSDMKSAANIDGLFDASNKQVFNFGKLKDKTNDYSVVVKLTSVVVAAVIAITVVVAVVIHIKYKNN